MLVNDYPDPKNVGVAVTIVRELGNYGPQEALDLMRLMGHTNSYARAARLYRIRAGSGPAPLPRRSAQGDRFRRELGQIERL